MTVNEEWFTTMPFEYEQQSWRLVGRLSLRGMTVFEYDGAEPSVASGVVNVLRIMWDGTSDGFSDEIRRTVERAVRVFDGAGKART